MALPRYELQTPACWSRVSARTMARGCRVASIALLLAGPLLLASPLCAAEGVAVLLEGEPIASATIESCEIDAARREVVLGVDGESQAISGLVRWGAPTPPAARTTVVLEDGSRLVTDRPWSPAGLARVEADKVRLRRGKAWIDLPRNRVRWVLLSPEAAGLDAERLPTDDTDDDTVFLTSGDQLSGRVETLSADLLRLDVAGEVIETPLEAIAAVRFGEAEIAANDAVCLVGLDDGTLIEAQSLSVSEDTFTLVIAGSAVSGDAAALVLVQPLGGSVRYLSDIEAVDYRHTPYLDLPWPCSRDTGLHGGPLVGGGRRAAKGIGLHSAARLVYRLDAGSQRFQAELAVANPAPDSARTGSVVFRVYLVQEGKFEPAYQSGVIRVGDPATPIDLQVSGADALALIVDYADNGDAGDDALWLDARLVATP
ncbi:NPCBM/NEW2 domain-containing protein [Botrimarina colliarenosi]|nr:NPCBM/NEW2 domain-containing protein [Botrimarina colliarenosi]